MSGDKRFRAPRGRHTGDERDDLDDLKGAGVLPPAAGDDDRLTDDERLQRARTPFTEYGLGLAVAGASRREVLAADVAENDRLDAQQAARREAAEQHEERRTLDLMERRLRLRRAARRERQAGGDS